MEWKFVSIKNLSFFIYKQTLVYLKTRRYFCSAFSGISVFFSEIVDERLKVFSFTVECRQMFPPGSHDFQHIHSLITNCNIA